MAKSPSCEWRCAKHIPEKSHGEILHQRSNKHSW